MHYSCFKCNLTLFAAIATLLFGALSHSIKAEATSTISGRIVDGEGNPIASHRIALQPLKTIEHEAQRGPILISQTDDAGRFSISNITPALVQLVTLHHFASPYRLVSIKITGMTVYQHEQPPFGGITFAIKPGVHVENVEVAVKPRICIRGQVIFADETPLSNVSVMLKTHCRWPDGMMNTHLTTPVWTDDAGYFVTYVDDTGFYTITASYQRLSATVDPFQLQDGERKEDVVFTFNSEPILIDSIPDHVKALVEAPLPLSALPGGGMWIVNLANGRAYKCIRCKSWDDANAQAATENAHLVSINDAAEQKWLLEIFGPLPYWIGLTDSANEGEWQWTSGEPVTYTNWAPHEPMDAHRGEEDYVFMGPSLNGAWYDAGPQSDAWEFNRMAIIEKDKPERNQNR